ncbi:MAG: stalk domain-containing protein [Fimbriimonadaceae bacterium]
MIGHGRWLAALAVVSGAVFVAAPADAFSRALAPQIVVDRAVNSPTLTVRFSGTEATSIELFINDRSVGTRSVAAGRASGETTFQLDLSRLVDGDNAVEIRLFDANGRIVGTHRSIITTGDEIRPMVYLEIPRSGQQVQGPVEIRLGFGREMRNVFVSFFVNDEMVSMRNVPPYTFIWDSTRVPNGWHDVEAWVVDESSQTIKTRRTKIFVNNPGGMTRRNTDSTTQPTASPTQTPKDLSTTPNGAPMPTVVGQTVDVRRAQPTGGAQPAGRTVEPSVPTTSEPTPGPAVTANPVQPEVVALNPERSVQQQPAAPLRTVVPIEVTANNLDVQAGSMADLKPVAKPDGVAMGPQHMTPTGQRIVDDSQPPVTVASDIRLNVPVGRTAATLNQTAGLINIQYGARIPNVPTFALVLDGRYLDMDVQPYVDQGIPLAPVRHLIEGKGGKINWDNSRKAVEAHAVGNRIYLIINDDTAFLNDEPIRLEVSPTLQSGRTIVPLSFVSTALKVRIQFDPKTNHVLITSRD